MKSKIYLAAAGSGKTTFLINSLSNADQRILYTTFTDENAAVAKEMIHKKYGCIPSNITVLRGSPSFLNTECVHSKALRASVKRDSAGLI